MLAVTLNFSIKIGKVKQGSLSILVGGGGGVIVLGRGFVLEPPNTQNVCQDVPYTSIFLSLSQLLCFRSH